jgi:hypothetical protein
MEVYVVYLAEEHVAGRENASKRVRAPSLPVPPALGARFPPTHGAMDMLPSFPVFCCPQVFLLG